jgi:hypothetical protein
MKATHRAAGLCLAVLLAGCSDMLVNDPAAEGAAANRNVAPGGREGEIRVDEPIVQERFRSHVTVAGALRPGVPVQVTVRTEALHDTRDAEIKVYAPEAQVARRGGWRAAQANARIPALARSRRAMGRGAVEVQHFQLTFDTPGRHRVSVGAFAHGELTGDGNWVADAGGEDLWLQIDEAGGRVLGREEAVAGEAGAFERSDSELIMEPTDPVEYSEGSVSGAVTRYHHPRYWNPVAGQYIVVPNVSYTVRNPNGSVQRSGTTQGRAPVRVDCAYDGAPMSVQLHMSNEWTFADGISYTFYSVCGGSESLVLFVGQDGVLHEGITVAGQGGQALFGARRSRIGWKYTSEARSYYRSGGWFTSERIFFRSYSSNLWFGGWASFIAGHEYGHAYQESFGGVPSADSGCDYHELNSVESLECAFREGWANYFAAATMPPHPVNGLEYYYRFRDGYDLATSGHTDGSRIEGAVAGFLVNLTGHVNGDWSISPVVPGSYVHNVQRYCEHETYNPWAFQHTWQRRTGIDHVVYCMENSVSLSGLNASNYFTSRDRRPRNQRDGVADPSRDLIRTRWMRSLYNQTWNPPTYQEPDPGPGGGGGGGGGGCGTMGHQLVCET